MSKASDIIDAIYTVEPDETRKKNVGVTHLSIEEWLPVSRYYTVAFCVRTVHNNASRI
jgi:hypothetical protein